MFLRVVARPRPLPSVFMFLSKFDLPTMNKLMQLISDGDGAPSTMRFAVLLIIVPIMTVWTVLAERHECGD